METEKMDSETTDKDSTVWCRKCMRTFTKRSNFYKHMKRFHPTEELCFPRNSVCSICEKAFRTLVELHEHITNTHDEIKLNFQELIFYSVDEFQDWKMTVEQETCSHFNKNQASRVLSDGRKASYYFCHRSGCTTIKKVNRKRNTKSRGTNKIFKTCPASIKVYEEWMNEAVEINVEYQTVHFGHDMELLRVPLNKVERNHLALLLTQGITKQLIINYLKRDFPGHRLSYVKRKDLLNICRDLKLCKPESFDRSGIPSANRLIGKMQKEEYNPVLLYKPVGEVLEKYPEITSDEFYLVIMNSAQQKLLELYGNSGIVIDSSHGIEQCGFQLTTIIVSSGDDNSEGLPVAILYSTRTEVESFVPFFTEIKNRIPSLNPGTVMYDGNAAYDIAWRSAFGRLINHFMCSWHVCQTWRANIHSRISDAGTRANTKLKVEKLLRERDISKFESMARKYMSKFLSSAITRNFAEFFNMQYMQCVESWAHCYFPHSVVMLDKKAEKWHKTLKCEVSDGRIFKLRKSLSIVLSGVTKALLGRTLHVEPSNLTYLVAEIQNRHEKSKALPLDSLIELEPRHLWVISSRNKSSTQKVYDITHGKHCQCNIRCLACNICVHEMSCTCYDFCIRFQICKHIHMVCQNFSFDNMSVSLRDGNTAADTLLANAHDESNEQMIIADRKSFPDDEGNEAADMLLVSTGEETSQDVIIACEVSEATDRFLANAHEECSEEMIFVDVEDGDMPLASADEACNAVTMLASANEECNEEVIVSSNKIMCSDSDIETKKQTLGLKFQNLLMCCKAFKDLEMLEGALNTVENNLNVG